MIINFTIQNFKSIKEKVTLSFEAIKSNDLENYYVSKINLKKKLRILKLGLIYGANASGKTTILQALNFLRRMVIDPFGKKTETLDYKPFLFDEEWVRKNSFFSLEFIQNKTRYLYEIEFNESAIVTEQLYFYNPNKALVYKRMTNESKQLSSIEFGNKMKINRGYKEALEANTLSNNTVLGGYLKTNFESAELREATDWFKDKLKPTINPKTNLFAYVSNHLEDKKILKSNVLELLRKADFNISNIKISKKELSSELMELMSGRIPASEKKGRKTLDEKEIEFEHSLAGGQGCLLPYKEESAGTQRYYQFSGLLDLMIRNEAIFPIDELESSLHPDLSKHFLLTFLANSKYSQVIATTHYRELLMERDIFRNDVIWFTEKDRRGATDLFALTDFDSSVVRDTSSIYNAYKTGKLGAAPNLEDYYIDFEDEQDS